MNLVVIIQMAKLKQGAQSLKKKYKKNDSIISM